MSGEDHQNNNAVPVAFVPTPTDEFRRHRKLFKATVQPGTPAPAIRIPIPIPRRVGARALIWKQDPTVGEIGIRKVFLPNFVSAGPRDARINIQGMPTVVPNVFGDLIETPGTDAFDSIHTFAVVRQTLSMYQRALHPNPVRWQWNGLTNTEPLSVFPHAGVTMNAYYSRTEKVLKFFHFTRPGDPPSAPQVFTCRSFDIVAHETGHAILDGLKPDWLLFSNPPQTGGLHESFGDLTAIFLALSQLDQVEAVISQTKANLHDKTFLADLAEEFGLALGRPNGLRNADNDLKLSQVGTEVHAISQVFTGAIYDILADIFAFERRPAQKDDSATLYEVSQYVLSLVMRALIAAPNAGATFAHVANQMLNIANADRKPTQYRNFIRNRFVVREVIVSPTPLEADHEAGKSLTAKIKDEADAPQDRRACCGTMQLPEYLDTGLQEDIDEFKKAMAETQKAAGQPAKAGSRG